MPELVTCPACGCSVQVADALLGRRVRCFGCHYPFVATPARPGPPSWRSVPAVPRSPLEPPADDEAGDRRRGPYCPGCGRRITWEDPCCPHCGEELEPEDDLPSGRRRAADEIRRDCEPHRGPLLVGLGNFSMIVGGLTLCTFGIGALVSVPVGVLVWLMANRDLEHMRDGRMDPRGKAQTETGRSGAIAGLLLGLIFAAFYTFVYLAK